MPKETKKEMLLHNIGSLLAIKIVGYVIPLVTIPYLVRVLGPMVFGQIAFATAITQYLIMVTSYSFDLTATRQLSINRDSDATTHRILTAVFTARLMLMAVSAVALIGLIILMPGLANFKDLYFVLFGQVIAAAVGPKWIYQGLEKLQFYAILEIFPRFFATLAIFILVKDESDYLWVPGLSAIASLASTALGLLFLRRTRNLTFCKPNLSDTLTQLREGIHLFISQISVSLYANSAVLILGMLTNSTEVGYFSAADKIVGAIRGLTSAVSQATFPAVALALHRDRQKGLILAAKILFALGGAMLLLSVSTLVFAPQVVSLLLGIQFTSSLNVLRIMTPLPLLVAISNIFGTQLMINFGADKAFSKIIIAGGGIGILCSIVLVPLHGAVGSAVSVLLSEVAVTFSMTLYVALFHADFFSALGCVTKAHRKALLGR